MACLKMEMGLVQEIIDIPTVMHSESLSLVPFAVMLCLVYA